MQFWITALTLFFLLQIFASTIQWHISPLNPLYPDATEDLEYDFQLGLADEWFVKDTKRNIIADPDWTDIRKMNISEFASKVNGQTFKDYLIDWIMQEIMAKDQLGGLFLDNMFGRSSSSLVINFEGYPVISYFDLDHQIIKLATPDSNGWIIQVLDNTEGIGAFTSIAINEQGKNVVAYFDDNQDDVKLGVDGNITNVRSFRDIGWYVSLALDQDGNPWITYYDYTQIDLGIVRFQGGRYQITAIAIIGDVGLYPSLKFILIYGDD